MGTINSRVAVATHILVYLAWRRGRAAASAETAASVNTNPVVVRRLVSALRDAGLVSVQQGPGGGAELAREPESITLLDVYRAVEPDEALFSLHPQCPSRRCHVGRNIVEVLDHVFGGAESALESALAGTTIRDVYDAIAARMSANGAEEVDVADVMDAAERAVTREREMEA